MEIPTYLSRVVQRVYFFSDMFSVSVPFSSTRHHDIIFSRSSTRT